MSDRTASNDALDCDMVPRPTQDPYAGGGGVVSDTGLDCDFLKFDLLPIFRKALSSLGAKLALKRGSTIGLTRIRILLHCKNSG
jgi:hypothetical protein